MDTQKYDAELVKELRARLALPIQGSFEFLLKNVSPEDFVIVFFKTVQPYAEMMSDLLCMFETAWANKTNENLAISFDFGQDFSELKFNLYHFKNYLEIWKKVSGIYLANQYNRKIIWELNKVLRENHEEVRRA